VATRPDNGDRRRREIEAWWALVVRILAAVLGMFILAWQTTVGQTTNPIPWLVGAACLGPVVAAALAQILAAWRGEGPDDEG
jgi:hypothetical protein